MAIRRVETSTQGGLLARILDTPDLARVVQSLEPAVLHRLVRQCGLEDSSQIVALATTEQLMRIFDDDLWRSDEAGSEEQLDADRFGLWLEVLVEAGADVAARKVAEMDFDFVTAAMSQLVLVIDSQSVALDHDLSCEMGGFWVVARRAESWDAVLSVLTSLEADHHAFFGRLMTRCFRFSIDYIDDNGGLQHVLYEVLSSEEQVVVDVAADREQRREQDGYVPSSQAAAFLKLARQAVGRDAAPAPRDHATAIYFRHIGRGENPRPSARTEPVGEERAQVDRFVAMLREAGVVPDRPLPLLPKARDGGVERLPRIRALLLQAREHDAATYARRQDELGYLANVLIAGCSFQSRRFRTVEAANAVLAACNLGLENWPRHWPAPGWRQDLVTVFRVGWSLTHAQVLLHVAKRLAEILAEVTANDADVQDGLRDLCRRLKAQVAAGTAWRVRDELDVLAILDQPSWATLLGLLDECPVVPKLDATPGTKPLRVETQHEFISENRQIAWAREFLESLPGRLVG